jgi:hypothetical protein
MAPEVWTGQRAVPATDLYALGVMFFEAVCGKAPFEAADAQSLRDMHLYTPVPRPKSVNPNVPDLLDGIIKRLLSKPIQSRYQTADEVLVALQSVPKPADATIVGLADRIRRHHDTAEVKALEYEKAASENQDSQARIKFMERQLLELVQEVVDEVNSQLVEIKITRRDIWNARVYDFQGRELIIHLFAANELYTNPEIPGLMATLRKRHAVHGGFIEIREHGEDHEGWNLVLVRPPEDLYGEWRLIETRVSPLTSRATKYEPVATNAQLFATNLAYHWMPTMHSWQITEKELKKADIVRILGVLIPHI